MRAAFPVCPKLILPALRSHTTLLDRVRRAYPELTESQRRLADYLVSNYRDAAFMTASKLADAVDLNEATVVRFAQRLDYAGYPALVREIRDLLQHDLAAPPTEAHSDNTPLGRITDRVAQIAQHLTHVSPTDLLTAANWICESRRIYIVGHGGGAGLAVAMAQELMRLGRPSLALSADMVSVRQLMPHLTVEALLIVVSVGTETADLRALAGRARNAGAKTLAIARHPLLESAQATELCLCLPPAGPRARIDLSTVAVLIDGLVLACEDAMRRPTS